VKFDDTILGLFDADPTGIRLVERYQVAVLGSKKINGLLCTVEVFGMLITRLEALLVAESESVILIVDGRDSITVDVEQFYTLAPFLARAAVS
jgi:hypothetical protein